MKLATFRHRDQTSAGLVIDTRIYDLSPLFPSGLNGLDDLVRLGDKGKEIIIDATSGSRIGLPERKLDDVQLLAPIRNPGKIICVGLNYLDHCLETKTVVPESPIVFAKWPSAIVGPDDAIVLRKGSTVELDWEVELVVVIGSSAGPDRPGSLDSVFGYTIGNDISARDIQRQDGQWTRAKSLNTFCPLGPVVVTSDEFKDPMNLEIGCKVNGIIQQDSNTSQMIFDIPYLLDWITRGIDIEAGDLIFTGTPHGTGAFQDPPVFLGHGDNVTAWINGIGELNNVVKRQ